MSSKSIMGIDVIHGHRIASQNLIVPYICPLYAQASLQKRGKERNSPSLHFIGEHNTASVRRQQLKRFA